MRFEDTPLNEAERAAAEKWMTKHKSAKCADATFDVGSVVSGYGYRLKVICMKCGEREDVTDAVAHDPYPHR